MRRTKRGGWPYSQSPNVQFELNKDSPQAKGLVAWWPMLASRGINTLRDLFRAQNDTITGPAWVNEQFGFGLFFQNAVANSVAVSPGVPMTAPFSIGFWARPTAADGFRGICGNAAGAAGWYVRVRTTSVYFRDNAGGESASVNYTATGGAQNFVFTLNDDASAWNWYIDGNNVGNGANIVTTAYNDLENIGRFWNNNAFAFDGTIYELRTYNRVLTDTEAYQLHAEPWELCKPLIRRWLGWKSPAPPPVGGHMTLWGRYWGP